MFNGLAQTAWTGPAKMREMLADLVWETETARRVIKKGFKSDLYSVEWLGKLVVPDVVEHLAPAILHDEAYTRQDISRKEADDMFLEAMKSVGIAMWRRWAIYLAVRIGGGRAWRRNKRERTSNPRAWFELHGIYRPEFGPRPEIDNIDV